MSIIRYILPDTINKKMMYIIGKIDSMRHRYCLPDKFDADEVYPGIYIGNLSSSMNIEEITKKGITHIMSVMNGSGKYWDSIKYSTYHVNDDSWIDLSQHFESAIGFIDNAIFTGGKVLVHCREGVSRSVTMVLAYIIYKEKISPSVALKKIQDARSKANPNNGFMRLLQKYYEEIVSVNNEEKVVSND